MFKHLYLFDDYDIPLLNKLHDSLCILAGKGKFKIMSYAPKYGIHAEYNIEIDDWINFTYNTGIDITLFNPFMQNNIYVVFKNKEDLLLAKTIGLHNV